MWIGAGLVVAFAGPLLLTLALTAPGEATPREEREAAKAVVRSKSHRIVFQVNSEEPTTMRHAITNALNAARSYGENNEPVAIEIVAYGPGVHMFRADTSPVRDLLQLLRTSVPSVVFSVCGNTRMLMERAEGHPLSLVEGAQVVPAGIVRLTELQEAGWTYIRP
ncbi:DsrE family protein [Bradyrhizobium sp. 2TAF24]|uniref:DsrE family protein n=1 Tax=Bradyrhizobium sp. 2TAF24 TaxID=3233011 RepID=UPI003F90C8D3